LNIVELQDMAALRSANITKSEMRTIIRLMGEVIQAQSEQASSMSSGFGLV
jgi:hypothetical protein